jgi:hypothetical protein
MIQSAVDPPSPPANITAEYGGALIQGEYTCWSSVNDSFVRFPGSSTAVVAVKLSFIIGGNTASLLSGEVFSSDDGTSIDSLKVLRQV